MRCASTHLDGASLYDVTLGQTFARLLRHKHHVEIRDAYVHVCPPLAQELARSRHRRVVDPPSLQFFWYLPIVLRATASNAGESRAGPFSAGTATRGPGVASYPAT